MQPLVLFERSLSPRPDRCCVLERHIVPWMWQPWKILSLFLNGTKEEVTSKKRKKRWLKYVLDGGALCMEPLTKRILLSRMKKG
ncbi:uncharacterized protein LOC117070208 isoform X4 [Trachypithecus francoisi]|uniref:uncharacterized protein LOC117070208 isoform X4 n=1 Tax=Trachypithecus francoisi TaxID=54180 RepID=UPI00141BB6F2|nr:uncharacterized protein LOC117070208 isoform X4 [Trachypithecus francoisi]